jgi:hypothetical protein
MRYRDRIPLLFVAAICTALLPIPRATAHGILGNRFFPPTIATDDPFAVDEFAFPTVSYVKNAASDGPSNHETDAGFEFDKEILPHFAMGVSDTFIWQKPLHSPSQYGWDNLALTAKYELWENPEHEAIVSVGLEADIGGTGSRRIGRDSFTTLAPRVLAGKGFGDLPQSLNAFRPLAVTTVLDQTFPTSSQSSNAFEYNFAFEYSLQYLQQNVQDIGLPEPFKNMIPLVEFTFSTPENRGDKGLTTGLVNPGVLWETNYFQLGAEANIPLNGRSGAHVGVTIQMWIYIDDIFPRTFGHPLFGERS